MLLLRGLAGRLELGAFRVLSCGLSLRAFQPEHEATVTHASACLSVQCKGGVVDELAHVPPVERHLANRADDA